MGAAAGADQGAFGLFQFPYHLVDLFRIPLDRRFIGRHGKVVRIFKLVYFLILDINGEIDQHRPFPSCVGNVERFFHDVRHILRLTDDVAVFHKGFAGAGNIRFLEHIATHEAAVYLPGDDHQRDAVRVRRGNTGDHIGGAGAAGNRYHAHLPGQARIAASRVGRMLFVAHQNRFDVRAARIAEYIFYVFQFQTLYNCVRTIHVGSPSLI